jgi:hypothetical protein
MGNIRCKNCNEEFSSKEKYCPGCGEKKPTGGKRVKKSSSSVGKIIAAVVLIVLVIIVVILLVKVLGSGNSAKTNDDGSQTGSIIQQDSSTGTEDTNNITGGSTDSGSDTTNVISLESVALDITEVTLRDGDNTVQLSAAAYPEGIEATFKWVSSDPSVATVDENGFVTAVGQGTASINVYCEDKTAACTVYSYVTSAPSDSGGSDSLTDNGTTPDNLTVTSIYSSSSVEDITLKQGEKVQLYLNDGGSKVTNGVTWTSDNSAVSVDNTGYVTANSTISGYATITASFGGHSVDVIVRVK